MVNELPLTYTHPHIHPPSETLLPLQFPFPSELRPDNDNSAVVNMYCYLFSQIILAGFPIHTFVDNTSTGTTIVTVDVYQS